MQSLGCTKFVCPLLTSHVYSNLFSSNPTGTYFIGFKINQVDWIKKGLFILAFVFRFMIRALDLMDLSQEEASVLFQTLSLTWKIIFLCFQVTQVPKSQSTQQGLSIGVSAHFLTDLSYSHWFLLPWYKSQHWVSKCKPLAQAYTAWKGRLDGFFFLLSSLLNCCCFRPPHSLTKIWSKMA